MSHGNNHEQLIGTVIAHRFAIERVAGEGGMGVVYKARDITDNRPVALKILHRQTAASAMADPSRFLREAQLLAELRHPSIVSYVAHGQTSEGQFYLAMEWLSGLDLGKRLQTGPLTLTETLTLCRTVAEALAAAHRLGIVHRDAYEKTMTCFRVSAKDAHRRRTSHGYSETEDSSYSPLQLV